MERYGWVGAFRHYQQDLPGPWGNKARGNDLDWATAVTNYLANPAHHPARSHDLGTFRGVAISGRAAGDGVRLFPRTNFDDTHTPGYETLPGRPIEPGDFAEWLAQQHLQARIERNALHLEVPTQMVEPSRSSRMER